MNEKKSFRLREYPAWKALVAHHKDLANQQMADWFAIDPERFSRFSLTQGGLLFDFSKNRITPETLMLLVQLAEESNLAEKIAAMFRGDAINLTENRAVLHTALRASLSDSVQVNQQNIIPEIVSLHDKLRRFTEPVRNGQWLGVTGKPIRDIVNIGIGGSDLGPKMAVHALSAYADSALKFHFISDVDAGQVNNVLKQVDPERVLFIISSKSFTTPETLLNAKTVRRWLTEKLHHETLHPHFVAVTAAPEKAIAYGILEEQIFPLWDWVGGRYSIWSAIGLPLILQIGMQQFEEFLAGARAVDRHFRETEFSQNMPVLMALLGIWNINFLGANGQVIAPYMHELHFFRDHIQQMDMESNGKSVNCYGEVIDYSTSPIIIGESGCDSQHSFFQLVHQGPAILPIDFILQAKSEFDQSHQEMLVASALSQSKALMFGKSDLLKHKALPGNRPSNVIFMDQLTPYRLGQLIALYEHKVFVQGMIWQINSFDQFGVELGKELLPPIVQSMQQPELTNNHDSSTQGLMDYFRMKRK